LRLFVFDVGGVIAANTSVVPLICEYLDIPTESFVDLVGPHSLHDLQRGRITVESFVKLLSSKLAREVPLDIWERFFHPSPIEETLSIVRRLKKKYRVVSGTNTIVPHYAVHLERGDYNIFDKTYASHIMGLAKPDHEFYRHILAEEKCPAYESIFVDDTLKNVKAAKETGMIAIHFTEPSILEERLKDFL